MGSGSSKAKAAASPAVPAQPKPTSAPGTAAKALEGTSAAGGVRSLSQDGEEHTFQADPKAGKVSQPTFRLLFASGPA